MQALLYLWDMHIGCTDLKPHNIFVDKVGENDFKILINDYFLEQAFCKDKGIKNWYGSMYFCAPEVIENSYEP